MPYKPKIYQMLRHLIIFYCIVRKIIYFTATQVKDSTHSDFENQQCLMWMKKITPSALIVFLTISRWECKKFSYCNSRIT